MSEENLGPTPQQVAAATKMGWQPLEKFKGDPEKWVDADQFVERGEQFMPILKANNARLQKDLLTRDQKIDTLTQQLENLNTAVETLKKSATQQTEKAVEQALTNLKVSLREARESGDVDREVEILDAIQDTQETRRKLNADAGNVDPTKSTKPPAKKDDKGPYSEQVNQFEADHPEIFKDKKKTRAFVRMVEDMRDESEYDDVEGIDFLELVLEKFQEGDEPPASKVESPRSRSAPGAKSYAGLPSEVKAACESFGDMFYGEGKLHKDKKSWQEAYARDYYGTSGE